MGKSGGGSKRRRKRKKAAAGFNWHNGYGKESGHSSPNWPYEEAAATARVAAKRRQRQRHQALRGRNGNNGSNGNGRSSSYLDECYYPYRTYIALEPD